MPGFSDILISQRAPTDKVTPDKFVVLHFLLLLQGTIHLLVCTMWVALDR